VRQVLGEQPWCKAVPAMRGVQRSQADIIVMADADVFVDQDAIAEAVSAVHGGAVWAVPHSHVFRLTESASEAYRNGERADYKRLPLAQPVYRGIEGGGVLVIQRKAFLHCPLDPRFVGWGQEDHSLGLALQKLYGSCWRGNADLVHQWHPEPPRMDRKRGSPENWSLFRRYCRARASREAMESLISEARAALELHQPTLHDHHPLGVGSD
jgi:hypothetical protein